MTNIIEHPSSGAVRTPLRHSIRTGEMSYRSLESLYAQNRLPVSSVVIDASKASYQREFVKTLIQDEVEVVLDTKCAELSVPARFNGFAKGAPWHAKDSVRSLAMRDFQLGSVTNVFEPIAQFTVELGVHAIHSPGHFLAKGAYDPWFEVDISSLLHQRASLNRKGRTDIGIDYVLMMPNKLFQEAAHQERLLQKLAGLPFDNLVIRLSDFGSDAGYLTMKRTFKALKKLHALNRPIVLDHIGGFIAFGALAFNYVSGIAHGIGERERFDARSWHKPPKPRGDDSSFGRPQYIPLPGLDRAFKKAELELMLATPKGRRKMVCHDRDCCGPQGLAYLRGEHKAHIARQSSVSFEALNRVPNPHRASHFMNNDIRNAERRARDLQGLVTGDASIDKRLMDSRKRIDSFSRTFETLIDEPRRSEPPQAVTLRGNYLRRPA